MSMSNEQFISKMLGDQLYIEVFCQKYGAVVVEVVPNTEERPPQGLIYVFDNQEGGFSIRAIKSSLDEKIRER